MKGKIKLDIIIPIIIAIILVAVFVYLDYGKKEPPKPEIPWSVTAEPVAASENPERGKELNPNIDYGCGGPSSSNSIVIKEADSIWEIDKKETLVSLGRYRINPPAYTILDVPKLWVYFKSDSLSNRDDKWYGLEKSYISGMILRVNDHDREVKLGGDDYMFVELDDYPLGDYYPYDSMDLEFEFLIKLNCNNVKGGIFRKDICLDNEGEPLDYINDVDIQAQIRLFLVGCQDFTRDIIVNAELKYGN